jgi:uncharacterized protein (TIGR00251 family)
MHRSPSSVDAGEPLFLACSEGVQVRVRVAPKASRDAIQGTCREVGGGIALKVSLRAAPEGGKANAKLIRMLAKQWRVPQSRIVITAGERDRRKTLRIAGDPKDLLPRLAQWSPLVT